MKRKRNFIGYLQRFILLCVLLVGVGASAFAQKITVKGTVTDEDHGALPGVSVVIKGTTRGTISDADGKFSIVADSKALLVFSFVGMETTTIPVEGQTTLNVVMKTAGKQMDEVVVTAMGIKRDQKSLGYAISAISSKELTKVGSPNFASALYGKAAGVRITSAPGGATSAVSINIRGINSITGSSQPLIIVDGVPIRNGDANNSDYWTDTRIRGNGLIDINPEDIENISILKGASASALYGSEAANGVVVITTKSGKDGAKNKLNVDVNVTQTIENIAFSPSYQNEYGPGYDYADNKSIGLDDNGWLYTSNGTPYPYYRAYAQFGPKFDGRTVMGWDGKLHPYVAQPDNYKDFYRTGHEGVYNVAFSKANETSNYRFSYTHTDYQGIQIGGTHYKNTFNFNGSYKLGNKITTDIVAQYIDQFTQNRTERINRLTASYNGFFSRFDNMDWYFNKYQTSLGYKYVIGSGQSATPNENIPYNIRATELLDFIWKQKEDHYNEYNDRLIGSVTTTWDIIHGLKLRGRVGTDFTDNYESESDPNTEPISLGNSGSYSQGNYRYGIFYGDALLSYNNKIGEDFDVIANAGYTGRKESYRYTNLYTVGGLSVENWFNTAASVNTPKGSTSNTEMIKDAYFGTLSLGYKNYLFVEGTGRQERSSTLPPQHNSFFYPSVNSSFVYTQAFQLPAWYDYGKLRLSWGIVGNAPALYAANNAYSQGSVNGIVYSYLPTQYGNDQIKPENKYETEIGLENKFFKNRLGVELTYYNDRIVNQLLSLGVPTTTGAASYYTNVGELSNRGFEFAVYGTPVQTRDFSWDVRTNFSTNKNKIKKLVDGLSYFTHRNIDAGAALLVSAPGSAMGDFMAYVPAKNDKGQYIIDDNGLYKIDYSKMQKVGNAMPKIVGGFSNTITYKNFSLDFTIDYRYGGSLLSLTNYYATGAGMWTSTLKYRDAAHGGISYYIDGAGTKIQYNGSTGPNGEKVFHDGLILSGVKADGSANTTIVDAASYYLNTYTWGSGAAMGSPNSRYDLAVYKNNYIKFRELAIGYNLPKSLVQRIGCEKMTISLIGRNLFFIYKSIPNIDPESSLGTQWVNAAIEDGSSAPTRSFGFSVRASF